MSYAQWVLYKTQNSSKESVNFIICSIIKYECFNNTSYLSLSLIHPRTQKQHWRHEVIKEHRATYNSLLLHCFFSTFPTESWRNLITAVLVQNELITAYCVNLINWLHVTTSNAILATLIGLGLDEIKYLEGS